MATSVASWAQTSWTTTTSPKTTSISWSAGDVIVVCTGTTQGLQYTGVPTCTGLTFTQYQMINGNYNENSAAIYAAVAAGSGSSQTLSVSLAAGSGSAWGFAVWVITGASGLGNTFQSLAESAQSLTVSSGSTVCFLCMEYYPYDPGTGGTTGSGTYTNRANLASGYMGYTVKDWVNTGAGSFTFGLSSYASFQVAQVALEVTESGGGGGGTKAPPPSPRRRQLQLIGR